MTFGSCQPFKHALQYALSISTPHPSSHPHSQLASQPTIQPGSQSIGHLITTHKVTMCRVIKSHKKSFSPCELSTQSSTSFYHLKMPSTHWLPHDTDDNMKQVGHLNAIHPYQSSADTIKTSRKVSKYSSWMEFSIFEMCFFLQSFAASKVRFYFIPTSVTGQQGFTSYSRLLCRLWQAIFISLQEQLNGKETKKRFYVRVLERSQKKKKVFW